MIDISWCRVLPSGAAGWGYPAAFKFKALCFEQVLQFDTHKGFVGYGSNSIISIFLFKPPV
jgi:hypothetical protein